MILFDTNIISEIMSQSPASNVVNWINQQDSLLLFVSTISIAEINFALRIMPNGNRKTTLTERFSFFIVNAFDQRILTFDENAARQYAEVMGNRKDIDRSMNVPDGQIAAIARANDFQIVTGNIRNFDECGVILINPFDDLI
jgi:predicted nucleic acid-binding protein